MQEKVLALLMNAVILKTLPDCNYCITQPTLKNAVLYLNSAATSYAGLILMSEPNIPH